jgi:hypothetical protein
MPVDFQQALQQIREMGKQAPQREEELQELRAQASNLFVKYANELDTLSQLVDRAAADNPNLRCAAPFVENLDLTVPAPPIECEYSLLAADGSQINPDRHAAVEFGAINVGAVRMRPGNGQAPQELVRSRMMFHNDLFTVSGSLLTDDLVALMRDLAERQELVDMARQEPAPVVALTDGPLELFREPKGMPEFEKELQRYQQVLEELAILQVATAGYVDRPRGDMVVRLLELALLEERRQLYKAGVERPLRWVSDAFLFYDLLKPGERSAVFAIRSGSSHSFSGQLGLHFFYLNVGRSNNSYLSRVEIPRWVAENEHLLNLLHASLLTQARVLGARPYPYILHRAHEVAVISFDERQQLENMIIAELYRQGVPVGERSYKQNAKVSSSHTRSR